MKRFLLIATVLLAGGFGPTVLKAAPVAESGDTNIVSHTFTGLTGRVTGSLESTNDSIQSNQGIAPVRVLRLDAGHAPTLWTEPQLVITSVRTTSDSVSTGTTSSGSIAVKNVGDSTARIDTASFQYVHETDGIVNSFYEDTPTTTPDVNIHDTDLIALDISVDSDADTGSVTLSSSVGAKGKFTGVDAGVRDLGETTVWSVQSGRARLSYTTDTTPRVGFTRPGDTIEYTITVTNNGGNSASDVRVFGVLPDETTYVPGSLTSNNTLNGSSITEDHYDAEKTGPFDDSDDQSVVRLYAIVDTISPGQSIDLTFRAVVD